MITFLRLYKGDIKFTLGAAQRMVEFLERYFSMSGSGAICAKILDCKYESDSEKTWWDYSN
ncbi:MAG: hypothetical protein ABS08_04905 [Actinobacteria bacterium BACL4 MAG-120507-bin0]|nr:MAG: hypothetical protein ABS08_04905 [Actinobacteria bacterium BACL4 MAG-120507-bin0]